MALVRVRTKRGGEKNMGEAMARKAGLEVLDESTHMPDGRLKPPYPPKSDPLAKRPTKSASSAAGKRSTRKRASTKKTSADPAASTDTTTSEEDKS